MLPQLTRPHDHYAVVLNGNAGRVTPRLRKALREVVPDDRLFLTESQDHAREVLQGCVEREVRTVFAGGGDGTIVDTINTLARFRANADRLPSVGVLRLGTGNALAHWLGSGSPLRDLVRWREGRMHREVPVPMVEAEGTLFPFAGLGHDAAIVNDYVALKKEAQGRWWQGLATGLSGYFLAGLGKTVPNYLTRDNPMVTVTNLGGPAWRVDVDGKRVGPVVQPGELLYRGPAGVLSCATTPLYGYGLRMFPHALREPGRFQVRIVALNTLECVWNFKDAWTGRLSHPRVYDFMAERVRVVFDDAMPYQLGGDARGYRRELTFGLGQFPVTMVGQA